MDTDTIEDQATDALDAILPHRDPRYEDARAYLMMYLATDPATRRLAMRALKAASPDPEQTETASPPVAATAAPESGEDKEGAAAPRAEEAQRASESTRGPAALPAGTQSGQPRLWCGGKAREERHGVEIHRDDPSCWKFHPPKRVAHAR